MTSISSVNNAALLILQQTSSSSVANDNDQTAADKITAIVNGVSGETSPVKTQASSTINSALLDVKEKEESTVQAALDYLDSDLFQSSDPTVKDTLKKLISENGSEFALKVKMQQSKNSGISLENAIAIALTETINGNRDKFTVDEIVVGFKLPGGGGLISNIADINGNSTQQSLMDNLKEQRESYISAAAALHGSSETSDPETLKSISAALNGNTFSGELAALESWNNKWREAFGF